MKKLLFLLLFVCITVESIYADDICEVESCEERFKYVMWLDDLLINLQKHAGINASKAKHYRIISGSYVENAAAGTATLIMVVENLYDANVRWRIIVNFSQFGKNLAWHLPPCGYTASTSDWYGYKLFSGTITGEGAMKGATLSLTQKATMPFQVGTGASLRKATGKGASAWFMLTVVSPPSSVGSNEKYKIFSGSVGDFNFCTNGGTKLSLTVSKFEAMQTEQGVAVSWGMPLFERDKVKSYDLERSLDSKNWVLLTSVEVDPTGYHHYVDHPPLVKVLYYRLVMKEHGRNRPPEMVIVRLKINETKIVPNPVAQGRSIQILSPVAKIATVFSLDGRKIEDIFLDQGQASFSLFQNGYYVLRFDNGEHKKILVQ